jgi:hypothetical protein
MRYEDALVDASLALYCCPERQEAYTLVSDCMIATQNLPGAAKLLQTIQSREPDNPLIMQQYEMLSKNLASEKDILAKIYKQNE